MERIQETFEHTYTIDEFTVFFHGGHIYVGGKEYPIGQCSVDVMDLDEPILDEIDRCAKICVSETIDLLTEKTDSAAALAQERLNAVWDIVFTLPVFRDLNMDKEVTDHTFERLTADPEKWAQVQDPNSEGRAMYQGMLVELACFAEHPRNFRGQMTSLSAWLFNEDFEQSFPMKVSFVPMMHPTEEDRIFIAEKAVFNSLTDFLKVEFYRGLAMGNAPRRCHNCGRYFLLTAGYNTCYGNGIAPGETERTCRKVGHTAKEPRGRRIGLPARKNMTGLIIA